MKYKRIFFIIAVVYPLASWILDLSLSETHHWSHYIIGGIVVGVIVVTIFYFLNRNKKKMQ